MAFKKTHQLNPEQLTRNTQYCFRELELRQAHYIFQRLNAPLHDNLNTLTRVTSKLLVNLLLPQDHPHKQELEDTFNHPYFLTPECDLQVQYFRYKNLGIKKIRQFVKVAPRDLVKGGKYDRVPVFSPIFTQWENLNIDYTWNELKQHLNLFQEDTLIHLTTFKETHPQHIKTEDDLVLDEEEEEETETELNIFEQHNKAMEEYYKLRDQKTPTEEEKYQAKLKKHGLDYATPAEIDDYLDMLKAIGKEF